MLIIWIVTALPFAFVCASLYVLPYLSRRTQLFAVTVPPSFRHSGEARGIIRLYHYQVAVHSALGFCGLVFVAVRNLPNWMVLPLLWPAAGSLVAVALAHRAALRYAAPPSGIRQASLQPRSRSLPGGALLWAGPFAILAACAVYIGLHWNAIPARFAIHWGFDNRPNGWAVRSLPGVYMPMLIGTAVCLLMLFLVWQLATNSRGSTAMRLLTVRILLALSYLMAALFGWLTASLPLGRGTPSAANLGILMGSVAVIIGATVIFGMRAKAEPEPEVDSPSVPASVLGLSAPAGDYTDDRNWRGGVFYFNPDDPVLFIEKRIGIGYDLNFGNPKAWVFVGVIALIPVAAVLIPKL
jgi:uncharacterized membrane protein